MHKSSTNPQVLMFYRQLSSFKAVMSMYFPKIEGKLSNTFETYFERPHVSELKKRDVWFLADLISYLETNFHTLAVPTAQNRLVRPVLVTAVWIKLLSYTYMQKYSK